MRKAAILVFSASALMIGMVAAAQAQETAVPGTSQTTQAPSAPATPEGGAPPPAPLLMIGKMPVQVWAPVESPYNANINRTAAESPMWESDAP